MFELEKLPFININPHTEFEKAFYPFHKEWKIPAKNIYSIRRAFYNLRRARKDLHAAFRQTSIDEYRHQCNQSHDHSKIIQHGHTIPPMNIIFDFVKADYYVPYENFLKAHFHDPFYTPRSSYSLYRFHKDENEIYTKFTKDQKDSILMNLDFLKRFHFTFQHHPKLYSYWSSFAPRKLRFIPFYRTDENPGSNGLHGYILDYNYVCGLFQSPSKGDVYLAPDKNGHFQQSAMHEILHVFGYSHPFINKSAQHGSLYDKKSGYIPRPAWYDAAFWTVLSYKESSGCQKRNYVLGVLDYMNLVHDYGIQIPSLKERDIQHFICGQFVPESILKQAQQKRSGDQNNPMDIVSIAASAPKAPIIPFNSRALRFDFSQQVKSFHINMNPGTFAFHAFPSRGLGFKITQLKARNALFNASPYLRHIVTGKTTLKSMTNITGRQGGNSFYWCNGNSNLRALGGRQHIILKPATTTTSSIDISYDIKHSHKDKAEFAWIFECAANDVIIKEALHKPKTAPITSSLLTLALTPPTQSRSRSRSIPTSPPSTKPASTSVQPYTKKFIVCDAQNTNHVFYKIRMQGANQQSLDHMLRTSFLYFKKDVMLDRDAVTCKIKAKTTPLLFTQRLASPE
jgi:hypothetical protein